MKHQRLVCLQSFRMFAQLHKHAKNIEKAGRQVKKERNDSSPQLQIMKAEK